MHTVMLVDDEIFFRQGLRVLIDWEACGFRVMEEADNGEDAYALIAARKPDLVITDIRMPVMDGLELIRKVTAAGGNVPRFIIISGYDDFKYAQQAVKYGVVDFILKPVDEQALQTTLSKLDEQLRADRKQREQKETETTTRLVRTLIKGEADKNTVQQAAKRLDLDVKETIYYVFVEANNLFPWHTTKAVPTAGAIQAYVTNMIQRLSGRETFLLQHRNRFGWIGAKRDLTDAGGRIRSFAESLQRKLTRDLNVHMRVYVGRAVKGLDKLTHAYQTAADALQYRYVVADHQPVLYEHVRKQPLRFLEADEQLHRQLLEAVEEQDEIVCKQLIEQMFQSFQSKLYAPEAVKLSIHHNVAGILKVMQNMGNGEQEEPNMKTLTPILSWHDLNVTLQAVRELFTDFVLESANILSRRRKQTNRGNIQKIKVYIDKHFHENISLKSISGHFYMNSVYLGQLFKKTYGMYFNEYLLRLRVREAKKLLRQTDLRIYEVAEKVGFSNADYFVTQFEKIEGMTPSVYRNRLLES